VTARVVQANWVQIFEFRDGLVCRHREYTDTAAWAAEFQSGKRMLSDMLVDTEDAARQTLGAVAQMFHVTPEILAASPAVFIGTPKQCVVELRRRAEHWEVSQFIFGTLMGIDENQIRRLRKEVLAQI